MMAIDVKRLNSASPVDVSRCEAKIDKLMAERRMNTSLLAAASLDVQGDRQWFALKSSFRGEVDLVERLSDSRVDAVVPVKQVQAARRAGSRGGKVVHRAVLPGLVFVNIVPSNRAFAGLLRVDGVVAVVGKDGDPYPIGNREMNGFMDLAQAGAFDERNTPTGLVIGSKVRIKVGRFADFDGVLAGYAHGRTARVLTHLFGGEMTVDVTLAHIEKLE
jgi:transcription antitermination factor NusG